MKMRQSIAQFETEFREEAKASVRRRERLRNQAVHRSRVRRHERVQKKGTTRFILLSLAIIATAIGVTIAMFQTLALIVG